MPAGIDPRDAGDRFCGDKKGERGVKHVKRTISTVAALITLVSLWSLAAPAAAAEDGESPTPRAVHIQLFPQNEHDVVFLQAAEYEANVRLPATVRFAIPKGASVFWAGEVLGGDTSQDIKANHTVNPKEDYDEVVFPLTKARTAQVEATWHTVQQVGGTNRVVLEWVQRYPAGSVDFGFKAPTPSSTVTMTPAPRVTNTGSDNLRYYVTAPVRLAVGERTNITIQYTGTPQAEGSSPATATGPPSNAPLFIFVALIAGVAVALTIYAQVRKTGEQD